MYEKHASCIDTYTIFEYLVKEGKYARYLFWKKNLSYDKLKKKKGVIFFNRQGSPRQSSLYFLIKTFFILLKCRYFISSFYGSLPIKYRQFIKNNRYISLVGVGHGPVMLKTLVFNYPFCQDKEWDLYLVSSVNEKRLFIDNGWNEKKLIECSLPRFDCCKNVSHSVKKIFIMFTWRLTFEKRPKPIYSSKYLLNLMRLLNNQTLKDCCKKNKIEIILGVHHAITDICGVNINFPCKLADSNNLIDEINASDLFITDYSSIFWDSAYLNHPVIFYRLDEDDRFLCDTDISDIKNSKRNDNKLYNVFYNEDDVVNKIIYYIEHNFKLEKKYENKMNKFFYTRKDCTQSFLKKLEEKENEC